MDLPVNKLFVESSSKIRAREMLEAYRLAIELQ